MKQIAIFMFFADSEKLYTEAFETICAKYGKTFTWELKASLLGFQGYECADKIIKELSLPLTREEFMKECQTIYEKVFKNVELMPGIYLNLFCIIIT